MNSASDRATMGSFGRTAAVAALLGTTGVVVSQMDTEFPFTGFETGITTNAFASGVPGCPSFFEPPSSSRIEISTATNAGSAPLGRYEVLWEVDSDPMNIGRVEATGSIVGGVFEPPTVVVFLNGDEVDSGLGTANLTGTFLRPDEFQVSAGNIFRSGNCFVQGDIAQTDLFLNGTNTILPSEVDDAESTAQGLRAVGDQTTIGVVNFNSDTTQNMLQAAFNQQDGTGLRGSAPGITPVAGGLRYSGVAGGDSFEYPFGVWANYQYVDVEDDFAATAFDGDSNLMLVGADFSPWENFVAGVALGYEKSDYDTTFNRGKIEIDGFTVAPYVGALISDYVGVGFDLQVDATLGFAFLDVDTGLPGGVSGSTDSNRYFLSSNLLAGWQMGSLYLSGTTGFTFARTETDAFSLNTGARVSDTRVEFGQLSIGGEAAYAWDAFEPFVSGELEYDYQRDTLAGRPKDKTAFRLGLGVRYFGDSGLSGGVEYNTLLGRDDFDEDVISITIRGDF